MSPLPPLPAPLAVGSSCRPPTAYRDGRHVDGASEGPFWAVQLLYLRVRGCGLDRGRCIACLRVWEGGEGGGGECKRPILGEKVPSYRKVPAAPSSRELQDPRGDRSSVRENRARSSCPCSRAIVLSVRGVRARPTLDARGPWQAARIISRFKEGVGGPCGRLGAAVCSRRESVRGDGTSRRGQRYEGLLELYEGSDLQPLAPPLRNFAEDRPVRECS
ncbi:hypothetical protein BC628DRAFT_807258 [Trametes gibbosa]|nr:hypothetical protein BC628DRAFT_807258 [Trametes gibbosa]